MTHGPLASLHLGLSAEAMLLIDPQLEDRSMPSRPMRSWRLSMLLGAGLLLLLLGARITPESDVDQSAKPAVCASRCSEPPLAFDRRIPLSL